MELKELKRLLTEDALHEVEGFMEDNFKNEGFGGSPWPKRKRGDGGRKRRLLVGQGGARRMQRSLRVQAMGGVIRVASDVPYAAIHNEGGTINHPGGTPYITVGKSKARKNGRRRSLRNFGEARVAFLKKDGSYPEGVKFTEPHPINIPQRQYIGEHPQLSNRLQKAFEATLKKHLPHHLKRKL